MHTIDVKDKNIRTDLIVEQEYVADYSQIEKEENHIKRTYIEKDNSHYTTIEFQEITDKTAFREVQNVLVEELKKLIKPSSQDSYLIIGLGNPKSTPDSLGPKTLEEIIVTRYLFLLGEVEEGYANVAIYQPNVCGNTGIESPKLIKTIIGEIKPTKTIIIDALKASTLNRLAKTIQITDTGIHPGSGIANDQGEISEKTMHSKVLAIGIPTVVDINTITENTDENFMVTPTNIDFLIEKLSYLLGSSLNKVIHKNELRQIK